MKNYLIFDCYKTLIYKTGLEEVLKEFVAREFKVVISPKEAKRAFARMYDRYKFCQPKFKDEKARHNFYKKYNQELLAASGFEISGEQAIKLNEMIADSTAYACYDDTIPILEYYMKREQPLGLVSNWTASLEKILADLNLKKYFNFIHSSHNLGIDKPDPEIFNQVLKIGKKFNKIYYVGDDYELDVLPARQKGIIPILLDRENNYPAEVDCLKVSGLLSLKKIIK